MQKEKNIHFDENRYLHIDRLLSSTNLTSYCVRCKGQYVDNDGYFKKYIFHDGNVSLLDIEIKNLKLFTAVVLYVISLRNKFCYDNHYIDDLLELHSIFLFRLHKQKRPIRYFSSR